MPSFSPIARSAASLDPRCYQIAFLAVFLGFVLSLRDFTLTPGAIAAIFVTALGLQALLARVFATRDRSLLSALISALSLALLLRTSSPAVAALAAAIAVASKFTLRIGGKHVFNPTNLGIVATVLLTDKAWIAAGQWGSGAVLAFFLAALGLTVTRRVGRLDISLAFLASYASLQLLRVLEIGERPAVALHRLSSGALVIFAFFMISDPRSTPDARAGRIAFAMAAAAVAYVIQFHYYVPSAPIWALAIVSPLTPLIDALLRAPRFTWGGQGVTHASTFPR